MEAVPHGPLEHYSGQFNRAQLLKPTVDKEAVVIVSMRNRED